MPTIFKLFGFVYMFYSNEHEPIHIHVVKGRQRAKFSLMPVKLIENDGLSDSELRTAEKVIKDNKETIITLWNNYFNNDKKNG
ncbi:MAG: DUF4160 domain-containing protein [Bacteroidales bacterium]|jgi:hypothetical protein|nr:DUF4160 domain-containing protein [Bacteroidales bacterium]